MTSIFSNLSNILNLGGLQNQQGLAVASQPEATRPSIPEQVSQSYKRVSDQPGFNNALFRLGATLMAARERNMGLGESLLAGQDAFNSQLTAVQTAKTQAAEEMLKRAQAIKALQPETSALQKDFAAMGIDTNTPQGRELMLRAILKPQSQVNINNTPEVAFQRTVGEGRGKSQVDFINGVNAKAAAYQESRPALERMAQLLREGAPTGGFAQWKIAVGNAAEEAGMDKSQVKAIKDASNLQEIQGLSNKLAVPQAKLLGTNPTDADAKRIDSMVANINTLPDANVKRIEFTNDLGLVGQKVADYANNMAMNEDYKNLDIKAQKYQTSLIDELVGKYNTKETTKETTQETSNSRAVTSGTLKSIGNNVFTWSPK